MSKTFIERLNDDKDELIDPELILAMKRMPDIYNEDLVDERRKTFATLLSNSDKPKIHIINKIREAEDVFIEECGKNDGELMLPEYILRIEAQDVFMDFIQDKLEEEGLV